MKHAITTAAILLSAATAQAEDRALIIGIDSYSQPLNGAANDAVRFAGTITEVWDFPTQGITTLTNAAATSDAIMTALIDELVGKTSPGDRAILYFAGNGTRLPDGQPALIAHDADALLGKIPSDVIADILDLIPDRDVTVIIDAGFDGRADLIGSTLPRGVAGGLSADATAFGVGAAPRTIWNAAQAGQFAWEDIDRGVFTHALTKAMTLKDGDANADDNITNAELLDHLTAQTSLWCDTNPTCLAEGRGFSPTFAGPLDTTILTKPAPVAAPAPVTDPILPASSAPATYQETLGFVTDLFAPSNDAGLALGMTNGPNPQVGDIVAFKVSSDRPGQLVLLDVDPAGHLAQVFPSRLVPDGTTQIAAGATLTIPNGRSANGKPIRLRVSEPAGQGLLLAVLVEDDVAALTDILPASIANGAIPDAGQYLYAISQDLLARQADPTNPIRWSATYLPYQIQP